MNKIPIKDLTKTIKAQPEQDMSQVSFASVSIDSRKTKSGDCFFAIPGENFDGHDYVVDALKKGAAYAVVGKNFTGDKSIQDHLLRVDDTVKALGDIARHHRMEGKFKVVAITGSAGKTTTRRIVSHVLAGHFQICTAVKNYNNYIGLPLTLLSANPDDEIIVAELASNHPGEISYLTKIALPDIAAITNVHPSHLEGFGNIETIVQEKLSISEGLSENSKFIINGDCEQLVNACREKGIEFTSFGTTQNCDIKAENIFFNQSFSEFTIDNQKITLPLPGSGNIENALAAWSVCKQFNIKLKDFAKSVKDMPPVPMRTELMHMGTLTVLNDCYNANPVSMKNALEILSSLSSEQSSRKVFICGDMAELGEKVEMYHVKLGEDIARAQPKLVISVGRFAKIAAQAARDACGYDLEIKCFADTISACNNLSKLIEDYDIVLVKGSRTVKLEQAVEKLKELFADKTAP